MYLGANQICKVLSPTFFTEYFESFFEALSLEPVGANLKFNFFFALVSRPPRGGIALSVSTSASYPRGELPVSAETGDFLRGWEGRGTQQESQSTKVLSRDHTKSTKKLQVQNNFVVDGPRNFLAPHLAQVFQ